MQTKYLNELNLSKGCSLDEIIKAYRKRAMQVHPDKGGTSEQFINVKIAYEWLLEHHNEDEPIETETEVKTWKKWKSTLDTSDVDRYSNIEQHLYESGLGSGFRSNGRYKSTNTSNDQKWDGKQTSSTSIIYYVDLYYFLSNELFEIKVPGFKPREFRLIDEMPGYQVNLDFQSEPYNLQRTLSVTFLEKPSNFKIDGYNLSCKVELDFSDIYHRRSFSIDHPSKRFPLSGGSETLQLSVPDNFRSDDKLRVPNLGLYNKKTKTRGDLYVELVYYIPKA
jgi:DnaJ-class molecular chaperone